MAIEEVQTGLAAIRQVFDEYEAEAQFDSDELVVQLREFEKSLRDRFQVGKTLTEKLSEAIAEENYELAAQLRDQLNSRQMRR
jgi:protein-arginine kinase activator protein McsA